MSLDVTRLVLARGGNHPGTGFSTMEAVAFAAGEGWTERPRCASPVLTEWMIAWNDSLDDAARQSLRRYIWRLVGSRGARADERARQWMAADWLVRCYASQCLAASGLLDHAEALARLPALQCETDVVRAWPLVRDASRAARSERDRAWRSAASLVPAHDWNVAGAVWDAVADATWGAAGSAARAVIWSKADPSAPGRVEPPMWDAACDTATDAAAAVAWVALRDAVRRRAVAGGSPAAPHAAPARVQRSGSLADGSTPHGGRAGQREVAVGADAAALDDARERSTVDPLAAAWEELGSTSGPVSPALGVRLPDLVTARAGSHGDPDDGAEVGAPPGAGLGSARSAVPGGPVARRGAGAAAEPADASVDGAPPAAAGSEPADQGSPGAVGDGGRAARLAAADAVGAGVWQQPTLYRPTRARARAGSAGDVDVAAAWDPGRGGAGADGRAPSGASPVSGLGGAGVDGPAPSGASPVSGRGGAGVDGSPASVPVGRGPEAEVDDDPALEAPAAGQAVLEPMEPDDMWRMAWETARGALAPTRAAVQAAAHELVDDLLSVTE